MAPPNGATRSKHYHGGAKGSLTGTTVRPAPAWRAKNIPDNVSTTGTVGSGSKILMSSLPLDVSETEIVDLLKKTIGPVDARNSFILYTERGTPRGMAVVTFIRTNDAAAARARYNGKVIDGKRPIKLEIILDYDTIPTQPVQRPPAHAPNGPRAKPRPRTLIDRIDQPKGQNGFTAPQQPKAPNAPKAPKRQPPSIVSRAHLSTPTPTAPSAPMPTRKRQKKGPKRVKKSVADLDREMEEYVAAATQEDASMETA